MAQVRALSVPCRARPAVPLSGAAVATAAFLSALRLKLGQFVRMWFGGVPVTFQTVGRIIDPQYGGQLLAYGRDTLADEGAAAPTASAA